jgi:hypothetical protein
MALLVLLLEAATARGQGDDVVTARDDKQQRHDSGVSGVD